LPPARNSLPINLNTKRLAHHTFGTSNPYRSCKRREFNSFQDSFWDATANM
jgi:hypothetical protein